MARTADEGVAALLQDVLKTASLPVYRSAEVPLEAGEIALRLAGTAGIVGSPPSTRLHGIDCAGTARVNFFLEPTGCVLISELNITPSRRPASAPADGGGWASCDALIERLVQPGLQRAEAASQYRC